MGTKDKRVNCPQCRRRIKQETLERYEGLCHVCDAKKHNRKIKRRTLAPDKTTHITPKDLEESFNLWEIKEDYEKKKLYLNQNPKLDRTLFVRWYMANEKTRIPETKREVAFCLDCTVKQLDDWFISKEFKEEYDRRSFDDTYFKYSHKILKSTAKAAADGDRDMIKAWLNMMEKMKRPEAKKDLGKLDPTFKKMVKKVTQSEKNPMGGVSLKKDKKEIAEKIREEEE